LEERSLSGGCALRASHRLLSSRPYRGARRRDLRMDTGFRGTVLSPHFSHRCGNQKPETRNQKAETRNQKPETRRQQPAARGRNQESSLRFWFLVSGFRFLVSGFRCEKCGLGEARAATRQQHPSGPQHAKPARSWPGSRIANMPLYGAFDSLAAVSVQTSYGSLRGNWWPSSSMKALAGPR
jgi:hypothetical protein